MAETLFWIIVNIFLWWHTLFPLTNISHKTSNNQTVRGGKMALVNIILLLDYSLVVIILRLVRNSTDWRINLTNKCFWLKKIYRKLFDLNFFLPTFLFWLTFFNRNSFFDIFVGDIFELNANYIKQGTSFVGLTNPLEYYQNSN